ncbi:hypothetical protein [Streptomyces sp. MS1.AVA.4]|uniref:Uncharacterized protein n=1 Tax=Streptomyces pratisoli TaxID=3139917 RepID=A0ACC6QUT0_9ACTN
MQHNQQPQYQPPQYPGPPIPPPPQPKKNQAGKIIGLGCLGIVAFVVFLAACAAILDPDTTTTRSTPRATTTPTPTTSCLSTKPTAPAGEPITKYDAKILMAPVTCAPKAAESTPK